MSEILLTENLKFSYQTGYEELPEPLPALNGIDLTVEQGEFIAILGRNGSGKSTLARHINALIKPTEGTVFVAGRDTRDDEQTWEIRKTAGMVFQNPDNQLIATIVEDDVAFGPENLGIPSAHIRERVDAALADVEMSAFAKSPPHQLSGGQKQRVAIAGVLAMKPDCIVLDEPTAMLDPVGRADVMSTITSLNRDEGITIILITHNMEEAAVAERVLVMDGGKVVLDGSPRDVFTHVEELYALGLGIPQAARCAAILRESGLDLPQNILSAEELVDAICRLKQSN